MNNISPLKQTPKFTGSFKPGKIFDFTSSNAPKKAVMLLYSGTVATRLVCARDKYEFKETAIRDTLGWSSLFFASVMSEKAFAVGIENLCKVFGNKENKSFSLFKNAENKIPTLIEAFLKHELKSFADIAAMTQKFKGAAEENAVKVLKNKKIASYLLSLGSAIAVLGILIPKINVALTRKSVEEEKKSTAPTNSNPSNINSQKQSSQNFQAQTLTMQGFLKQTASLLYRLK